MPLLLIPLLWAVIILLVERRLDKKEKHREDK